MSRSQVARIDTSALATIDPEDHMILDNPELPTATNWPELRYHVILSEYQEKGETMAMELVQYLDQHHIKPDFRGLIFCRTIAQAAMFEETFDILAYHSDKSDEERTQPQPEEDELANLAWCFQSVDVNISQAQWMFKKAHKPSSVKTYLEQNNFINRVHNSTSVHNFTHLDYQAYQSSDVDSEYEGASDMDYIIAGYEEVELDNASLLTQPADKRPERGPGPVGAQISAQCGTERTQGPVGAQISAQIGTRSRPHSGPNRRPKGAISAGTVPKQYREP
ncbi:predicted protein [Postia placenta Mad-698-R]|nr:predicted protein [Postia placenta Mad-698-R]